MITGEQKPVQEILEIVKPYKNLLILGCGTCIKTCFAGGEDEVAVLASALRLANKKDGKKIQVKEFTIERQCENDLVTSYLKIPEGTEAVLSLACGQKSTKSEQLVPLDGRGGGVIAYSITPPNSNRSQWERPGYPSDIVPCRQIAAKQTATHKPRVMHSS